ncbi:MAG: hypothetical protein Q8P24_11245 [Desulfobacterales bacterium]|nr:hypothetical protein [Desulfobacterales bacterium]
MKDTITMGIWGAVGGAILAMIIGFNWGGWVLGSTARGMAVEMAEAAVARRLAPVCFDQFKRDPEKDMKLAEMKQKDTWGRTDYVKEQVWAKMPGEKESDREVARGCAELIMTANP